MLPACLPLPACPGSAPFWVCCRREGACQALKDHWDSNDAYDKMAHHCKLLARKFPETTAETVSSLFAKSGELGLLAGSDLGQLTQQGMSP